MSESDARALHAKGDHQGLWSHALPLVKSVLGDALRRGELSNDRMTDDLLQECNLAAGRAVRVWEPDKGLFSTWIWARVRSAMQNFLKRESSGIIGGRDTHTTNVTYNEFLAEDENSDTFLKLLSIKQRDDVRAAIATLPEQERNLLTRHFGLGLLATSEPLSDIGRDFAVTDRTMRRMLMRAIAAMRVVLHQHEPESVNEQERLREQPIR